jgi:hypothetical protein
MLALLLLCPIAMVAPVLAIVAAPLLTTPLVGRAVDATVLVLATAEAELVAASPIGAVGTTPTGVAALAFCKAPAQLHTTSATAR